MSRQVTPGLQVELCLLCLPPGFRRCHIISTFHQLVPAPRRTVRAQLTHTAPQTIIRALIETRCGAVLWPPLPRFCVRPVFPYSARPSVASFPPAALPAFAGTMRRSDSLSLICLPPFGRLWAYSRSLSSYCVELFLRKQRQGLPGCRAVSMSRMPWSPTPRKRTPPHP